MLGRRQLRSVRLDDAGARQLRPGFVRSGGEHDPAICRTPAQGNSLSSLIYPSYATPGTNVDLALPLTGGGAGGGAYSEILAGSLVIKVNGVITCQDAATPTYNLQGATFACTGAAANSSWVNYATGAFSIAFASPPANTASITASWTVLADPLFTGGSTPSAQTDWVGYGPASSGVVSSAITKVPGGLSAWFDDHCPNNAPGGGTTVSDGWINTYPNGALSLTSLWSYALGTLYPSNFPQLGSTMPVMSFGYWHDQNTDLRRCRARPSAATAASNGSKTSRPKARSAARSPPARRPSSP